MQNEEKKVTNKSLTNHLDAEFSLFVNLLIGVKVKPQQAEMFCTLAL